jgi:mannan endo-1,4-beta-mannosidase
MNGNWYPWSSNSTPQDFIQAWHHIHDIFSNKSLHSTRLQWIWCVNNVDVGNYTAENYWVGDNYVDWLGIDGYNFGASQSWGSWSTPNQVFDNMIARLLNLSTKPICINEYATTSIRTTNTSDIQAKAQWLAQFCSYIDTKQIKMASYFNTDKETDWAVFNGMHGDSLWYNISIYTAYKDCLLKNDWLTPDSANPRIITDAQFAGNGKIS